MFDKTLFTIFGREVKMYGICIAVGIIICLLVFYLYTKKKKMPTEVQDFTFFVAIISIVIGFGFAALYQSIYKWITDGVFRYNGITFMGGLIGGVVFFILIYFIGGKYYFKGKKEGIHKREFNKTFLVAPCCITIAHAFGRLGCMCAGCCYGMEAHSGFTIYNSGADRIPVQLYEAIFLFVLFAVLSVMYFKRCNFTMHVYLIAYAIWRFIIEYYRGDVSERGYFLGLFPSQWQSIVFALVGVALFIYYIVKKIPLILPKEEALVEAVAGEGAAEILAEETLSEENTAKEIVEENTINHDKGAGESKPEKQSEEISEPKEQKEEKDK